MKIKRYIAKNMSEACQLIKQDIGPDAVIVSSRKIREKGLKGLFIPRKVEVTAAIDENPETGLQAEIGQIKELLKGLPGNRGGEKPVAGDIGFGSILLTKIRNSLLELDIAEEVADYLLRDLDQELASDLGNIKEHLIKRATAIFKPAVRQSTEPEIMAFIGPPGIGKTTTLAKLGAIYSLFNSFKIGFFTIDTFRIGAVEQLQIYGEIIGAAVEVIATPEELATAVAQNQDKDIILIDTAGRPSRNKQVISELKSFLDSIADINTYLVINATIKNRDLVQMLKDYQEIGCSGLVFTKVDETATYGAILNAAYLTGLPIVFVTTGQNVPDDIEAANPELLAKLVLGDVDFGD